MHQSTDLIVRKIVISHELAKATVVRGTHAGPR
jgi:hypothetical protein